MILSDYQIHSLCESGLVSPFDPDLINPASLDVRIGNTIIIETPYSWERFNISDRSSSNPVYLEPNEFMLVATLETFNIPNHISGEFKLKSSRAREGYDNALAVWLDPGWSGSVLTMELKNNCRYHRLPIYPGLRIGQIIFHTCNPPLTSYKVTGRYNHDSTVRGSKDGLLQNRCN